MANIAVLIGNGLSVALTHDLALEKISSRFFSRLNYVKPADKVLVESLLSTKNDKIDFEKCIAIFEKYSDEMHDIEHRRKLGEDKGLDLTEYANQEKSLRESLYLFSALIVEIVNGNVKQREIEAKLPGFVQWLSSIIDDQNEVDLFTLNYDLLLETILLNTVGPNKFMEFYHQAGPWFAVSPDVPRYFFKPDKAVKNKKDCRIKLYHLHGSLSSFKDLKNKKIFKIRTETIREYNIYSRISELNIAPSIITGGRKRDKVKEDPFCFYYNKFIQKMSNEELLCDKLFIIGYSFRDEHINSAIMERMKLATQAISPRPLELTIVDYANSAEEKAKFIRGINTALGLTKGASGEFIENDRRILSGGADSIGMILNSREAR